jgi:hypothetical protein
MNGSKGQAQRELPLFAIPVVHVPTVRIPQPDGSILIKAGKPVILDDEVTVAEAAKLIGLAKRTIEAQCALGQFRTACKPGGRPGSKWKISREEVLARRNPPAD